MATHNAKKFWESQKEYPFDFTRRRRIHELNYLIPRVNSASPKSLLDLGCGDGALLECLLRTTDVLQFYGYDLSAHLLKNIDPRIKTSVFDITQPEDLPDVDAIIMAGVIQYVFDDEIVSSFFSKLTSPVVWIRSTCTLQRQREEVNRDDYASCYRTVTETHDLIAAHFKVNSIDRIYPDDIESSFGTKQFYFEGVRQ